MTEHKFEPFQQVLVRSGDKWVAAHFSHVEPLSTYKFCCTSGLLWAQCIPYTSETAHLLGTSQPYEPPKPPVEYEWGQKVEVYEDDLWHKALYLRKSDDLSDHLCSRKDQTLRIAYYPEENIRPLTDTAAHLDAKP